MRVGTQEQEGWREHFVNPRTCLLAAALAVVVAAPIAAAQDSDTEKGIKKFRQMLKADPWANPGLLDVDRGEALWHTARGPNNVTLKQCDLGKGPGKVEGAFAELPRYFADAGKVMDLETRILWCMVHQQGFKEADLTKNPHPGGGQSVHELGAMATYVASKSDGMKFNAALDSGQGRFAVALGDAIFHRRSGPFDFGCVSCHGEPGKRIRLQNLPELVKPAGAREIMGDWPAYRVSTTNVMTMQHRLVDCFWQMRMPRLELGSEVSVALIAYLTKQAEGGEIHAPGLKR
jgi:sulfur-oxidizing protein SoxA